MLAKAGRHEAALALVAPLVADDPDDFDARFVLAKLYRSAGRIEDARAAIAGAVAISPEPKALALMDALATDANGPSGLPPHFPALPAAWTVVDELRLVDALVHERDYGSLALLIDAPASTARPLIRASAEARLFYHHQCFDQAIDASTRALAMLDGEHGLDRDTRQQLVFQLETLRARSLVTVGRSEDVRFTPGVTGPKPTSLLRRELDLWWRSDPARGLAAAEALIAEPRPPVRALILACMIPLEQGDVAGARRAAGAIDASFAAAGRPLPAEYALAALRVAQASGDGAAAGAAAATFFGDHGLAPPPGFGAPGFRFDMLEQPARPAEPHDPLVTVIVTAFNAERTLATAVRSLLAQTHPCLQVIVVDDASRDGTRAVAERLAGEDDRVELVAQAENAGTYVGRNVALARARGSFYTVLDADDWAHPERIERHLALHRARPDVAASASDWIRVSEDGRPLIRPSLGVFSHRNPGSVFMRVDAMRTALGGYEPVRIDADNDHWLRLLACFGSRRVVRLRDPLTLGRHHDQSLTRAGTGAQDRELYSPIRSAYRARALAWRRAGGALRIDPADAPRFPDLRLDEAGSGGQAPG